MKKYLILTLSIVLFNCSSNDNLNNCNFLFDVGVNYTVNTNLPEFAEPLFNVGNGVVIPNQGNGGIIVMLGTNNTLLAWDAADPNHAFSNCSILTVNGSIATCNCEDANQYTLFTGQSLGENPQPCTLKPYRVDLISNNQFLISNF